MSNLLPGIFSRKWKDGFHVAYLSPDRESKWYYCTADQCHARERPLKIKDPLLLVLSADLFFCARFAPGGKNSNMARKAARMQAAHFFPHQNQNQESFLCYSNVEDILVVFARQQFQDLLRQELELVQKADLVTAAPIMAWKMYFPQEPFIWQESGIVCSVSEQGFSYGISSPQSSSSEELPGLSWEDLLTDFARREPAQHSLRIPVHSALPSSGSSRRYIWYASAVSLAALLFIGGQAIRLQKTQAKLNQAQQKIEAKYREILGPDPGNDPYGRLLYLAEQSRSTSEQGLNMLDLLRFMSGNVPENFLLQSISFSGDTGTIKCLVADYDQLETMLNKLKAYHKLKFSLFRASNVDQGVEAILRIEA
jgi:hypothetical protein